MNERSSTETVVAESMGWPTLLLLGFFLLPFVAWGIVDSSLIGGSIAALSITILVFAAVRLRSMRVVVDNASVRVNNFFMNHTLELASINLDFQEEDSEWIGDDIPESIRKPNPSGEAPPMRKLVLSDRSGQEVRVGLAPSYGTRAQQIADDLEAAVIAHRGY